MDITYPKNIISICDTLKSRGKKTWLVGGSVRDAFMGKPPHDWDLATTATPNEVISYFSKVVPTGIDHGTVTVIMGGENYEVTTLRSDGQYSDGRRPNQIVFAKTIEEDLARRDFTCNAIASDPLTKDIVDPFNGINAIKNKEIKAVGDPIKRFEEDGLRIMRAARFAATLNFNIETNTWLAMSHQKAHGTFAKVSIERIRDEWMKAMVAEKPSIAFEMMRKSGMLDICCPELVTLFGCEQNDYHEFDVWKHTMLCLDKCRPDPLFRIAALFHDIAKPVVRTWSEKNNNWTFIGHEKDGKYLARKIMKRMKFSNEEVEYVSHLVRMHLIFYNSRWSGAAVRRWIKKIKPEHLNDIIELATADSQSKGIAKKSFVCNATLLLQLKERALQALESKPPLSVKSLAINGNDLISELSISTGPKIGTILKRLMDHVLDHPEDNDRDQLLILAKNLNI